jgi:rubredoxin
MSSLRDGFHHHVCPECWHIWSHDGRDITAETVDAAHVCPGCGVGEDSFARAEENARQCAATKVHTTGDPIYDALRELLGMA